LHLSHTLDKQFSLGTVGFVHRCHFRF